MRDGRDLNSQRPAWQAGALTKLNYHPNYFLNLQRIAQGIITIYPINNIIGASFVDSKLFVSLVAIIKYPHIITTIPRLKRI